MTPGLGLSLVRRGARAPGFTPLALANLKGLWLAADGGPKKTGPAVAGDTETVATWTDLSGNGKTLTRTAASTALTLDIDGAPDGSPAVLFAGAAMSVAWGESLAQPWLFAVVRFDSTTAGMFWDSEGTGRVYSQHFGAAQVNMNAGSGSGSLPVVEATWGIIIMSYGTAGRYSWSGLQEKIVNVGTNTAENLVFGRDYTGGSPCAMSCAALGFGSGGLTHDDFANLRKWAVREFGLSLPSETEMLDTFSRADTTPGTSLGVSDSGHGWSIDGSGVASVRLLNGTLTHNAGVTYCWTQANVAAKRILWTHSTRVLGGGDVKGGGVILIEKTSPILVQNIHFGFSSTNWDLGRFTAAGGVLVSVTSRTLSATATAGDWVLRMDHAAGIIYVTDPDGIITACDWNAAFPADPLSGYNTQYVALELLAGAAPVSVIAYDRVQILP